MLYRIKPSVVKFLNMITSSLVEPDGTPTWHWGEVMYFLSTGNSEYDGRKIILSGFPIKMGPSVGGSMDFYYCPEDAEGYFYPHEGSSDLPEDWTIDAVLTTAYDENRTSALTGGDADCLEDDSGWCFAPYLFEPVFEAEAINYKQIVLLNYK
jgi:hypothetical protein